MNCKAYTLFLLFIVLCACSKNDDIIVDKIINVPDDYIEFTHFKSERNYDDVVKLWFNVNSDTVLYIQINDSVYNWIDTISFNKAGFYNIRVKSFNFIVEKKFVIINNIRQESEWGLKPWSPNVSFQNSNLIGKVDYIYPRNVVDYLETPVAVFTKLNNEIYPNYLKINTDNSVVNLKRGVGSLLLNLDLNSEFQFEIDNNIYFGKCVRLIEDDKVILSDTLNVNLEIEKNSLIFVDEGFVLNEGVELIINQGCVFLISKNTTIYNYGIVSFKGVKSNPIYVTCNGENSFWGGIVSRGTFSKILAEYTFFTKSGINKSPEFQLGHANCQALFQLENSEINLSNCYVLDNVGQIFYPENSNLILNHLLVQRCKTGGQLNNSTAFINNCVFTDFPNDNSEYLDDDNDALYIAENCNVEINNSTFMYAKDDGLDSGSALGGNIEINNSYFEGCFHEGAALSSYTGAQKTHTFNNCVFANNGQGLELGFSVKSQKVYVNNCLFRNNYIGIRYGDNYDWADANGMLIVNNSVSKNNEIDVWNMVRSDWNARLSNTQFNDLYVSKYCYQYPQLKIIK